MKSTILALAGAAFLALVACTSTAPSEGARDAGSSEAAEAAAALPEIRYFMIADT